MKWHAGFTSWIRLILYVYENNNRGCVILNVILSFMQVGYSRQD